MNSDIITLMTVFITSLNAVAACAASYAAFRLISTTFHMKNVEWSSKLIESWYNFNSFQIETGFLERHGQIIAGNLKTDQLTASDINVIYCLFDLLLLHFLVCRDYKLDNDLVRLVLVEYIFKLKSQSNVYLTVIGRDNLPTDFVNYIEDVWQCSDLTEAKRKYQFIHSYFSLKTHS